VIIIGDEANPLYGDILIEFIPIGRLGFDDQAAFHSGQFIRLLKKGC
jgi:hypothetical protein